MSGSFAIAPTCRIASHVHPFRSSSRSPSIVIIIDSMCRKCAVGGNQSNSMRASSHCTMHILFTFFFSLTQFDFIFSTRARLSMHRIFREGKSSVIEPSSSLYISEYIYKYMGKNEYNKKKYKCCTYATNDATKAPPHNHRQRNLSTWFRHARVHNEHTAYILRQGVHKMHAHSLARLLLHSLRFSHKRRREKKNEFYMANVLSNVTNDNEMKWKHREKWCTNGKYRLSFFHFCIYNNHERMNTFRKMNKNQKKNGQKIIRLRSRSVISRQ